MFFNMKKISLIFLAVISANLNAAELPKPQSVKIQAASDEGMRAMQGFKLAEGLSVNLIAAEPLLANPVAFDIDEKGNFYCGFGIGNGSLRQDYSIRICFGGRYNISEQFGIMGEAGIGSSALRAGVYVNL